MAIAIVQNNEINLKNYLKISKRTDTMDLTSKNSSPCDNYARNNQIKENKNDNDKEELNRRVCKHVSFLERTKYIYFDPSQPILITQKSKRQFKLIGFKSGPVIDLVKGLNGVGGVLENVSLSNFGAYDDRFIRLEGHVIMNNLAFEKKVMIRYTLTSWKTFKDVDGFYVNSLSLNLDRFVFFIKIYVGSEFLFQEAHLETFKLNFDFAIKFEIGGNEYWDNNGDVSSKCIDISQIINEIEFLPDWQCRTALSVKEHPDISILLNSLPVLDDLIMECDEFSNELSGSEKIEMLKIYFENLKIKSGNEIKGEAFRQLMLTLCQEKAFDLIRVGIENNIFSKRNVLIHFSKHRKDFLEAVEADILEKLDVTIPIFAGRGILHIFAEEGEELLCVAIINRLNFSEMEIVRSNHFSIVDGNSILHSAVLSGNPELIGYMANNLHRLCSHQNKFGFSPLKLALANGNDLESIRVLLEYNCVAVGEEVLKDVIKLSKLKRLENIELDLDKFFKWAPRQISQFRFDINDELYKISDIHLKSANCAMIGLINSYGKLISTLDYVLDVNLIRHSGIFPYSSSNSSTSDSSIEFDTISTKISSNILSILSNENFELDHFNGAFPKLVLSNVIDTVNFNFCPEVIKAKILKNLTKVDLDYYGSTLTKFINKIIKYSEPSVLAHFVSKDIDYYFCIRSMFDQYKNERYEFLIPFLDAIGFHAKHRFRDGTYPIHLAVKSDNINLFKFLYNRYKANLFVKTAYEHNNVLHYGLDDRISKEMSTFLLKLVPELLLIENNFHVSPIQLALMNTRYFDQVQKFISAWQNVYKELNYTYSREIYKIYREIMKQWPNDPKNENCFKDKFNILFETCGSESVARLLLNFVSKKLFKHIINDKGKFYVLNSICDDKTA